MKITIMTAIVIVALMIGTAPDAHAQIVPFKSVGTDNAYIADPGDPNAGQFSGFGNTSHMGKTFGIGFAAPLAPPDLSDLANIPPVPWVGEGRFTAKNGASIEFSGGGLIFLEFRDDGLFDASWIGTFNIQDIDGDGKAGTGRFSNVGPAELPLDVTAINHPFSFSDPVWFYDYEITGQIDLGKKK